MAGAVWTQDRAHRAGLEASADCPFCGGGVLEDDQHLWWQCGAWKGVRERHKLAMGTFDESWPACLKICGLMLDGLNM